MSKVDRINAARHLVAAPILLTLSDICAAMNEPEIAAQILATLPDDLKQQGEIVIDDEHLKPYTLRLRLSKVPKEYRFSVCLPSLAYDNALKAKMQIFITATIAYWKEWANANYELVKQIARVINIDKIYNTDSVLFWNRSDPFWIGIVAYLTDGENHIYR